MDDGLAALAMRGVRKTFEAENAPVRALRGVDLTVASSELNERTWESDWERASVNLRRFVTVPKRWVISVLNE